MSELPKPADVLPHRPPFLFIDEVLECEQLWAKAVRTFREEEEFFRGHFPERPIVPGVILLEGMAQTFAYLAMRRDDLPAVYLTGVDRARFRRPVFPGQRVEFIVRVEGTRMNLVTGKAEARVDNKKVADARLTGLVTDPSELQF